MLNWIKSFFTAQDNTKKPITDMALNYQARAIKLKTTSIQLHTTDNAKEQSNNQATKFGKVWIQKRTFMRPYRLQHYNNNPQQTFNKEVKLDRGTIFAIEREIEVLKAVGEYKGHYFSGDNKVVIISTPLDNSWQTLESINVDMAPKDILNITKQICADLKELNDKGFLHNDLHLGNIMIRNKNKNEIEARLIDYDRAIKIGEYTNDQGDQFDPPIILEGIDASTEAKHKNYISMSPTYTNNLREAQILFLKLKKITKKENHELLRDSIIDHYLLPHPTPPKAKSIETASLNNQDIITLPNNTDVLATTQLIQQQHIFRNKLKTNRTNNITSKTFIIYPYKNFFGIKSSSLQNVIMIDEQGDITNLIHDKNTQQFYTKTFFSKQEFDITTIGLQHQTTLDNSAQAQILETNIANHLNPKKQDSYLDDDPIHSYKP